MIRIEALQKYYDQFEDLDFEPIVIEAKLRQSIVFYDPLYLDNLLARAVINDSGVNTFALDPSQSYDLPVPCQCLWRSTDGFPLWAASTFMPVGGVFTDTVYLHKRLDKFELSQKQPKSNVGRWVSRRIPKPVFQSETKSWKAFCFGNAELIQKYLRGIQFLGKHRNIGYGEISEWSIESWNGNVIDTIIQDKKLIHAIPEQYTRSAGIKINAPTVLVGWTPPQWKPDLFRPGWPVGTVARDSGRH